jgi:TetR/AcrR family transcriptional regulator, mexJK operon transcriptional repressor
VSVQLRQEAKREQIRLAAADLFLDRGFAETSMDAITSAAGVSKETLYRYYDSKASLFADVLSQLIAEPKRLIGDHAKTDRSVVRNEAELEALLVERSDAYLKRVLERKQLALLRIVIAEGSRFPDLVEAFRGTLPATGGAMIISALEAGRAAGLLDEKIETRLAARAFAGLLMMFIFRDGLLVAVPRRPERRQVVEMVRLFVHGVRAHAPGPNG